MYDKFITSQVEGDPRSVFYKRVQGINFPQKKDTPNNTRADDDDVKTLRYAALLIKFTLEKWIAQTF